MPASIPVAYPVGVTDEEAADLVLGAEVDNLPAGLVAQVANASLGSAAVLVHGALQLPPSTGVLRTTTLLFGEQAHLLVALPLERTDATPGHDHGRAGICRDGRQVNFSVSAAVQ